MGFLTRFILKKSAKQVIKQGNKVRQKRKAKKALKEQGNNANETIITSK